MMFRIDCLKIKYSLMGTLSVVSLCSVSLFLSASRCRCEINVFQQCVAWLVANLMHILFNLKFLLVQVQFISTTSMYCFHFPGQVFLSVQVQIKSLFYLPKYLQLLKQQYTTPTLCQCFLITHLFNNNELLITTNFLSLSRSDQ